MTDLQFHPSNNIFDKSTLDKIGYNITVHSQKSAARYCLKSNDLYVITVPMPPHTRKVISKLFGSRRFRSAVKPLQAMSFHNARAQVTVPSFDFAQRIWLLIISSGKVAINVIEYN
jgi:hypothetical protein